MISIDKLETGDTDMHRHTVIYQIVGSRNLALRHRVPYFPLFGVMRADCIFTIPE